ncbi:hypothetical protein SEA_OCTOBIEN14_48 [Gordonia phage Octobien14]|uniref:Uncharacterized protein n=1 Tax=Gordonia phage Octobien14 TaxID=2483673 RepID=A0A3G3MB45_9CAUD|nr:hypothetical protein L3Y22_gp048 [Gordonia phage Octobien14]AYR03194.1 hypothetical protein SEA_OCTOBIEN14_48 [Gordonia phage Octobien14]
MTIATEDALKVVARHLDAIDQDVFTPDLLREEAKRLVKEAELDAIQDEINKLPGIALALAGFGWLAVKAAKPDLDGVSNYDDLSLRKKLEYYQFADAVITAFRLADPRFIELSDRCVGRIPTEEDEAAVYGAPIVVQQGEKIPGDVNAVRSSFDGGQVFVRSFDRERWVPSQYVEADTSSLANQGLGFTEDKFMRVEYPLTQVWSF